VLGCRVRRPLPSFPQGPTWRNIRYHSNCLACPTRRKGLWSEAVESIDFTHSSRLALATINNLTGRSRNLHRPCPITANSITSQLVKNGTYKTKDRESDRLVNKEVFDLCMIPTPEDKCISGEFSSNEFALDFQQLKSGKAPGPDKSYMPIARLERRQCLKVLAILYKFLSFSLQYLKLPKIWRRAAVVAIPKPKKPPRDPKSNRLISLLCVPFKIMEKLIYTRVETIVDTLLSLEQDGFRRGRSTVDQITLLVLTQEIEDSFSAKKKAGAVFIKLTAT